jgi:uncharacterized membrane protein YsdA (DUF1294 family)
MMEELTEGDWGWQALVGVVLLVNLVAFLAMGHDKLQARRGGRRVPERTLLTLAAATGAPGIWLGTLAFRHKTVKGSFRAQLVVATCLNAVWIWLLWRPAS